MFWPASQALCFTAKFVENKSATICSFILDSIVALALIADNCTEKNVDPVLDTLNNLPDFSVLPFSKIRLQRVIKNPAISKHC